MPYVLFSRGLGQCAPRLPAAAVAPGSTHGTSHAGCTELRQLFINIFAGGVGIFYWFSPPLSLRGNGRADLAHFPDAPIATTLNQRRNAPGRTRTAAFACESRGGASAFFTVFPADTSVCVSNLCSIALSGSSGTTYPDEIRMDSSFGTIY